MTLEFYIVDAFIDPHIPFSGNPAVVIILPKDNYLLDGTKQSIASEFNLSETVYLAPVIDDDHWSIRWFTPKDEVKLCGHATMAASHILFQKVSEKKVQKVRYKSIFHEKLEAFLDPQDESIILDFPCNDCQKFDEFITKSCLVQIKQAIVGPENLNRIIDVQLSISTKKLLIRLKNDDNDDFLRRMQPNIQQLLQIDMKNLVKGIIVTQKPRHNNQVHFWSRYFAPWVGIPEDPVTGSAHTVLTPYWSRIYMMENNKMVDEFRAKQVSQRGGVLKCRLTTENRVLIKGKTKIFCHGTIEV